MGAGENAYSTPSRCIKDRSGRSLRSRPPAPRVGEQHCCLLATRSWVWPFGAVLPKLYAIRMIERSEKSVRLHPGALALPGPPIIFR